MRASMIVAAAAALCLTFGAGAAIAAAPVTIHRLSGAVATNPVGSTVVMNAAGSAAALWTAGDPQKPRAFVALRTAKGTWGAAHAINAKGTSADAFVGIDRIGRVVVVWGQGIDRGANRYVFWSEHRPGGTWTKARSVAVPKNAYVTDFRLAADGTGVASLTTYGAAYVQVLTRAGLWRKAVAVSRVTALPTSAGTPSVGGVHAVITPGGAVTAVWQWSRLISRTSYCTTYQRAGLSASGHPTPIVTLAAHQCSEQQPDLSLSSSPTGRSVAASWTTGRAVHVAYSMTGRTWASHSLPARGMAAVSVALEGGRMWVWTAVTPDSGPTTVAATRYTGRWDPTKTIHTYRGNGVGVNSLEQVPMIMAVLTPTQQTVAWNVTRTSDDGASVRSWVQGGKTTETRLPDHNTVLALAAGGRHRIALCQAPVKLDYTVRYYTQDS